MCVCVCVCTQSRVQAEGACADPVELEAALQQLKEKSRKAAEAAGTQTTQVQGIVVIYSLHMLLTALNTQCKCSIPVEQHHHILYMCLYLFKFLFINSVPCFAGFFNQY